ncbi:DNA sulfur modification protein DndD [Sinorhizobium meliloti]|uniref:DNA sulfur modification protein DndD n=1 Tax=Rhizobium meliloti TaxID=382 RepID=UPI00037E6EDA|nr:DNA sulfur modification protein DndD [Sinorhizobium meliloti]
MIFDEITLYNFGLYEGRQSIKLTPPAPNKPIILIGGLNGGGKTTFLDALQLVLFGPHAKCSNRGSLAYSEYLSRCIHRQSEMGEAGIELSFRHTVEGVEEHYHLSRFWRLSGSSCKERFEVRKNGLAEPTLADNWATQVEEFFPANIAHLFLFDGEQIEAYASQHDSSALIGAAIQNLLGLDMVDQLEKDLLVYERRKRSEDKDAPRHAEITTAQEAVRDLRRRVDAMKQERAALQTHRLDKQLRALQKSEEEYRRLGGGLYDQRDAIEGRRSGAVQQIKDGETALRDYAGGAAPLLLVRALLESAEIRDQHEEECRRARELAGALRARDQAALKHLRRESADKKAVDALRNFFDADRAEREAMGKKDSNLDMTSEVRSDLHLLLRGDLNELRTDATKLLAQQEKRRAHEEQTRIEYESIPDSDALEQIGKDREELRSDIIALEATLAAMEQDIERQQRELERREQALALLLEADAKDKGQRDDRSRILRHSGKVRKTLQAFRYTVIARHVRRIEELVLESYQQLLRKTGLVTRLSINPEHYALTLYGRDDDPLSAERLSAGERQLLAIALLWGLAKASGRPLPTAIDTPLGRLDSVHRLHLVERYLPFASHQILLLSTDEEITGEYHERLRPWIGHTYQLAHDDTIGATRIATGYLPSEEAA